MPLTCQCPASTPLTTINVVTCAERFGQIQKIIFQRLDGGNNKIQDGTEAGKAGKYATWSPFFLNTLTGDTKMVITPYVENPTDDGGDAKTVGGGNESLNGVERIIGSNPVNFSCRLNNVPQNVVAEIKALMCECLGGNLGVYLINENGQIEGLLKSGYWYPIPIQRLFVSDKHHGGLEADDYNDLSFAFAPGYSDNLDILTLDESALSLAPHAA